MEVVFRDSLNEAFEKGVLPFTIVCIKELGGLPLNILREFWHEFGRKETVMVTNENMELTSTRSSKASHWEAFLSALPFAIFGVVCMIGKIRVPWVSIYVSLRFYFLVLLGLLIGLVKAFPRWAYSYLLVIGLRLVVDKYAHDRAKNFWLHHGRRRLGLADLVPV